MNTVEVPVTTDRSVLMQPDELTSRGYREMKIEDIYGQPIWYSWETDRDPWGRFQGRIAAHRRYRDTWYRAFDDGRARFRMREYRWHCDHISQHNGLFRRW